MFERHSENLQLEPFSYLESATGETPRLVQIFEDVFRSTDSRFQYISNIFKDKGVFLTHDHCF